MQGITARVRYAKAGLARFIGHLDTARALLRAVRRAGLETLYTEGFTPRLRLSFGPPLPLGLTSDCEYMDIKLARGYAPETVKEKLQSQLPEGLSVGEVEVLRDTPAALQTAFWATEYEIALRGQGAGVRGQGPAPAWPPFVQRSPQSGSADSQPETRPAAAHAGVASSCAVPGEESAIVALSWREKTTPGRGDRVLSVTVRHDVPGGSRIREVVRRLLGIEEAEVSRLRIDKKRVFWQGERPPGSLPWTGPNPAIGGISSQG